MSVFPADRRCGFTLIEVMAAVSILAVVLTAVYRLQAQTIDMANDARFYTTAPLLAQNILSEFELAKFEDPDGAGDFGERFPGYEWNVTTHDTECEPLGATGRFFKRIEVVVRLNRGEYTYRFQTYRLVPEE